MANELRNNICLIGENVDLIQNKLDLVQNDDTNKIQNLWNIISFELNGKKEIEIDQIFNEIIKSLEKEKNIKFSKKKYSYTIIYSLNNFNEQKEIYLKNLLIKIVKICPTFFNQPFLIFLAENKTSKDNIIKFINKDEIQNIGIDKRNISCFISPLEENVENTEMIKLKILKIFSYFFEFGDKIKYKNNHFKLYKQNNENLYSINVLVLGKTQVGKSTFINTLLKEKRAKEGGKGYSITNNQFSYHLDNIPLEINDIEGFTGEKNINKIIKMIKDMQDSLGEKELHIVIYIINYDATTYFNDNEYSIFKQLIEKFDNTQFLFICTKSEENINSEKIEDIQKSFYEMIEKGLEEDKSSENIINIFKYLYYCQKKDIYYKEIKEKIDEDKFNQLNFFEKLDLKFKNYTIEEKNEEMISKILENGKTLFFVNLVKDDKHKKIFGMKNISIKIRKILEDIKRSNMKFINDNIELNLKRKLELENKIKKLKEKIKENEENTDKYIDSEINKNFIKENDECQNILDNTINDLKNIEDMDKDYIELINSISQNRINSAKSYAEKLKEKNLKDAKDKVMKYKVGAFFVGLIPILDLYIEYKMKKSAKNTIAEQFKDDLTDFDEKKIKISKEEENFIDIEQIQTDTSDKPTDTIKTIAKIGCWAYGIGSKAANFIRFGVPAIGSVFGCIISGAVMNYDINKYLEFYGKRLIYRYLFNLSFNKIEVYLKDNFENE